MINYVKKSCWSLLGVIYGLFYLFRRQRRKTLMLKGRSNLHKIMSSTELVNPKVTNRLSGFHG
uniref:Uncharacterized protein n=1 Tax=Daucus carota subsp. sativus TaxID=79200 RepID=A0A166GZT8_DAUCS